MIHEYSPIEIGLDALGVEPGQNPSTVFGVDDLSQADQIRKVGERIEHAMSAYPEIKTEILAAGINVLLGVSSSLALFRSVALPQLDRSVDTVAA
ncbi:hypothetical protein F7661_28940 (plasmid) [Pseudomonas sp. CFA]|nr:hypothetical protein F7661_28940 [Pseudomonas sp. CFA]